ncbi:uncharacterized protein EV420DRAFT_1648188 [Desarmillaria tabescens]|uniref:Uncharacterized protein n=1 Tax=Armillaria tabescens TaxID=1929756 RepID=A0AA39JSX6_ARMTA|nr:uncharacterized protein EV420DRAFT_1648188 [Desarmillaria tabescens]KAK0445963.1 hypothetical protein EV420DRAFT_1648188 [Desarmillaria tabescens]
MSKDIYPIAVAHYGAKAIVAKAFYQEKDYRSPRPSDFSSTTNYNVKTPQDLSDVLESTAYLGMVKDTPVTLNNTSWNCRYWVISALERLQNKGYSVEAKSLTDLLRELDEVVREDA